MDPGPAGFLQRCVLHVRVVWAATSLRGNPVDIAARVLDVACFAVYTVLGVNLQFRTGPGIQEFIDPRRAKPLFRTGIDVEIGFHSQ